MVVADSVRVQVQVHGDSLRVWVRGDLVQVLEGMLAVGAGVDQNVVVVVFAVARISEIVLFFGIIGILGIDFKIRNTC